MKIRNPICITVLCFFLHLDTRDRDRASWICIRIQYRRLRIQKNQNSKFTVNEYNAKHINIVNAFYMHWSDIKTVSFFPFCFWKQYTNSKKMTKQEFQYADQIMNINIVVKFQLLLLNHKLTDSKMCLTFFSACYW